MAIQEKTKKVYIATDGREFDTELSAWKYEMITAMRMLKEACNEVSCEECPFSNECQQIRDSPFQWAV